MLLYTYYIYIHIYLGYPLQFSPEAFYYVICNIRVTDVASLWSLMLRSCQGSHIGSLVHYNDPCKEPLLRLSSEDHGTNVA